ncbi:hypothetical protein ACFX13_013644 [Malus domestica]
MTSFSDHQVPSTPFREQNLQLERNTMIDQVSALELIRHHLLGQFSPVKSCATRSSSSASSARGSIISHQG